MAACRAAPGTKGSFDARDRLTGAICSRSFQMDCNMGRRLRAPACPGFDPDPGATVPQAFEYDNLDPMVNQRVSKCCLGTVPGEITPFNEELAYRSHVWVLRMLAFP